MLTKSGKIFGYFVAALVVLMTSITPAFAKRVALVLGNSAYKNTTALPNPVNDARAMSTKLRDLGFEVVTGLDQDYVGMRRTVSEFAKGARGADIALLFYAGHGMQVRGQNYLIPIDAKFEDETSLDFETMPVDFILNQMSNDVKVQMVFLDACRNNPLARSLASRMTPSRSTSVGVGLAEIKLQETGGEGSVIAFATSPGDVALDGQGQNSPFTSALLRHIDTPNAPIQNVMTRVTGDVYRETDQRQRPWVNASLIGEVFLNKTATAPTTEVVALGNVNSAVPPALPSATTNVNPAASISWEREKAIWDSAQKGGTIADYQSYLAAYPGGNFADFARNAIQRLQGTGQVASLGNGQASDPGAQKSVPGTIETEVALGWGRDDRRQVQTRLNLAGTNVGTADGAFGSGTRAGIAGWQSKSGFPATGYFTAAQYGALVEQTSVQYTAYLEQMQRAPVTRSPRRSNNDELVGPAPSRRKSNADDAAGAAFMGGFLGGALGGMIGR